jgi:hypothetical protein
MDQYAARRHRANKVSDDKRENISRAATSFWCYEAIGCLTANLLPIATPEQLSRVNCVLEAFCFFDRVCVAERCFTESEELFRDLDPDGRIVEIIKSDRLEHGQTLRENRITIDYSLHDRAASELERTSDGWYFEHLPELSEAISKEDPNDEFLAGSKIFHLLRLWQWSHCKEMSEVANATVLLPNSLQGLERYDQPLRTDVFIAKLSEMSADLLSRVRTISQFEGQPLQFNLDNMPPLLALFADYYDAKKGPGVAIAKLRSEMEQIRKLRCSCETAIRNAKGFSEKREIVEEWTSMWSRVCASDFKRPSLLRTKVTGGDVAKAAVDMMDLKLSTGTSVAATFLEHLENRKAHKRYQAYTALHDRAGNLLLEDRAAISLQRKFGIERFASAGVGLGS